MAPLQENVMNSAVNIRSIFISPIVANKLHSFNIFCENQLQRGAVSDLLTLAINDALAK
jgi:hypothetical protein